MCLVRLLYVLYISDPQRTKPRVARSHNSHTGSTPEAEGPFCARTAHTRLTHISRTTSINASIFLVSDSARTMYHLVSTLSSTSSPASELLTHPTVSFHTISPRRADVRCSLCVLSSRVQRNDQPRSCSRQQLCARGCRMPSRSYTKLVKRNIVREPAALCSIPEEKPSVIQRRAVHPLRSRAWE